LKSLPLSGGSINKSKPTSANIATLNQMLKLISLGMINRIDRPGVSLG
jgi:hypothetical protein